MAGQFNLPHLCILFAVLILLSFLYRRYEAKHARISNQTYYRSIQEYLLGDDKHGDKIRDLGTSKKPILWIHIPYEYNARHWDHFGSRSSTELNQPYLYLTVQSIIRHCKDSFTLCILDDRSFAYLLPEWTIRMETLSDPIASNMRTLGLMKLLYRYGGMICPVSFLCMKDLVGLYHKGTRGDTLFVCESIDRNRTSDTTDFYPSIAFCGAPKECETVAELCNYIEVLASGDTTAESVFLGQVDRWCHKRCQQGHTQGHTQIRCIPGIEVGIKTVEDEPILLDDLLSNHYLHLYEGTYGLWIPAKELLRRVHYAWFARLSTDQVIASETILGNYFLLSTDSNLDTAGAQLKPLHPKTDWVGFWKAPLQDVWGLKPNYLGDHLSKVPFARN